MISGANEEELELAGARMDIMLATNYTTKNPGPLAIIDKYHDKEIERLNNIINECAEDILKELEENHHLSYGVALGIRQKLIDYRELKEVNDEDRIIQKLTNIVMELDETTNGSTVVIDHFNYLVEDYKKAEQKTEGLNNLMNELEQYFKSNIEWNENLVREERGTGYIELDMFAFHRSIYIDALKKSLKKLKELKEGEKNVKD